MKYYIKDGVLWRFLSCVMASVMCVSCAVDDSYMADDIISDDCISPEGSMRPIGVYEGCWLLDGKEVGVGTMVVNKDSITFDTLPQEEIARYVLTEDVADITCEPVKYSIGYFQNGYSQSTYYYMLENKDYCYNMAMAGKNVTTEVTMSGLHSDLPNAIYNKGFLLVMLKISKIKIEMQGGNAMESNHVPAIVLMFNPVKRMK